MDERTKEQSYVQTNKRVNVYMNALHNWGWCADARLQRGFFDRPVLIEARQVVSTNSLRLNADAHHIQGCCTGHYSTAWLQYILLRSL